MNTTHNTDTEFHRSETTTLLELVAVVSDLTHSDKETAQVVRHMLSSRNFSFAQPSRILRLN